MVFDIWDWLLDWLIPAFLWVVFIGLALAALTALAKIFEVSINAYLKWYNKEPRQPKPAGLRK